jgi:hypothetical protein
VNSTARHLIAAGNSREGRIKAGEPAKLVVLAPKERSFTPSGFRPDRKTLDRVNELELGYRLKKKFWGKGYVTEVSRALIQKAFRDCGADFVFA